MQRCGMILYSREVETKVATTQLNKAETTLIGGPISQIRVVNFVDTVDMGITYIVETT